MCYFDYFEKFGCPSLKKSGLGFGGRSYTRNAPRKGDLPALRGGLNVERQGSGKKKPRESCCQEISRRWFRRYDQNKFFWPILAYKSCFSESTEPNWMQ